jgi:Protein of unknown function (DUF1062)
MSSQPRTMLPWVVRRTRLPLLSLRCMDCRSEAATTGEGRFRVNANGKLLDVWLLVRCVSCDRTSKLTVHERAPARRNRFTLDWKGAWRLDAPPAWLGEARPVQVEVIFEYPVPVRPDLLIAQGPASAGTRCCAGSSATFRCTARQTPGSPSP